MFYCCRKLLFLSYKYNISTIDCLAYSSLPKITQITDEQYSVIPVVKELFEMRDNNNCHVSTKELRQLFYDICRD